MKFRVMLDEEAILPRRAHPTDAGLDLFSREEKTVPAHGSAVFDTGVHIEIPETCAGKLVSKSGLNVKHGILSDGLIDAGYTGSITVKLYNLSDRDYTVLRGDKISQLVIFPVCLAGCEITDSLSETERGAGGFGSTGRN